MMDGRRSVYKARRLKHINIKRDGFISLAQDMHFAADRITEHYINIFLVLQYYSIECVAVDSVL